MTKLIPDYLRLHGPNDSVQARVVPPKDALQQFWDAYSEVTGWRVDHRSIEGGQLGLLPAVNAGTTEMEPNIAVSKLAATRLAESANCLAKELSVNRDRMRAQEMELAARAPILGGETEQERLADQVESLLAKAVKGIGCQAAAIYLLDDDTQQLKCRAIHGLPKDRLEHPARPLRGSRGDLQAMVDGVVAIEDLQAAQVETWSSPELYASAICTTLESDGVPIGTMWFFSEERKDFRTSEMTVAEFASTEIAERLRLAAARNQKHHELSRLPAQEIAQWQFESLPVGSLVASGWRVDGMLESPQAWASGWHLWDILPDGTLIMVLAESVDHSVKGAMTAALARAALTAHTGYRHTAQDILQRVSDTLWQSSTAEQLLSLLYARVDPHTGEGEVASAGNLNVMIAGKYGSRSVLSKKCDPLNVSIEAEPVVETFQMQQGETLMAFTHGFENGFGSISTIGSAMQEAMFEADRNPLARLRRKLANHGELMQERGAVTLLRE